VDLPNPDGAVNRLYRFTVADCYRLVEAGILEEDARVELLDGQIIPMAPIGPEHHWILDQLNAAFVEQRAARFNVGPGRSLPIRPPTCPSRSHYWAALRQPVKA
jgi:Uma2 family endonuclease